MATSAVESIRKLAKQHHKAYHNRLLQEQLDRTLTAKNIVYALEGLSSYWYDIGNLLNLPFNILKKIWEEFLDNEQCLIDVILHWLNSDSQLLSNKKYWEIIKDVMRELNKLQYIEIIEIHQEDFQRIPVQGGRHCKQLLPKRDTCYEDWWLDRVEFEPESLRLKNHGICHVRSLPIIGFEPDPLKLKVHQADLKDIVPVVKKYPKEWYEIGMYLGIPSEVLETIEMDKSDTSRRIIEMLSTWINSEGSTWENILNALKKIEYFQGYHDIMTPLKARSFDDSDKMQQKGEALRKKEAALRGLREILSVEDTVSDDDLIGNIGRHIQGANLNTDRLREPVIKLELLEGCMSEYSTLLREWCVALKKDLSTAQEVHARLFDRQQKLEQLQSDLERNREEIKAKLSRTYKRQSFFQTSATTNKLDQEILETEDKLKYIHEEIEASMKELDYANANYKTISNKLNKCQIELKTCVEEYQKFQTTIKLPPPSVITVRQLLMAGVVSTVLAVLFPTLILRDIVAGTGMVHQVYRMAFPQNQDERIERLVDSCVEQLEENRRELQAIQDVLNTARHPHGSTTTASPIQELELQASHHESKN